MRNPQEAHGWIVTMIRNQNIIKGEHSEPFENNENIIMWTIDKYSICTYIELSVVHMLLVYNYMS